LCEQMFRTIKRQAAETGQFAMSAAVEIQRGKTACQGLQ
jgi:hypothetical protein